MKYAYPLILFIFCFSNTYAQQEVKVPTSDEIQKMNYGQLQSLPVEKRIKYAEITGVSAEELLSIAKKREDQQKALKSSLSSSVITAEEIENSGVTTIEEALRLVPGMIIREQGNGVFDVHIRNIGSITNGGLGQFQSGSTPLVMIDNQPVYSNFSGNTFWETLPITLKQIERIEIVRGAATAMYGTNAESGVINIITKTYKQKKSGVEFMSQAGSYGTGIRDVTLYTKAGNKLSMSATYGYDTRNRYTGDYYSFYEGHYRRVLDSLQNFTGKSYYNGLRSQSINYNQGKRLDKFYLSLIYDVANDIQIKLTGGEQHSTVQSIFIENYATPFSCRAGRSAFGNLQLNIKGLYSSIYYKIGRQNLDEGLYQPLAKYNENDLNAKLGYTFKIKTLVLRPEIEYQNSEFIDSSYVSRTKKSENDLVSGWFNQNRNIRMYSASLKADYTFELLTLSAGLRAEKFKDIDKTNLSHEISASYQINEKNVVQAVYSKSYRSAFAYDLYANTKNVLYNNVNLNYPAAQRQQLIAQLSSDPATASLVGVVPENISYQGSYTQTYLGSALSNNDLKLMYTNLFEAGYRSILSDVVQVDVETFYSKSQDYDALVKTGSSNQQSKFYTVDELTATNVGNIATVLAKNVSTSDTFRYQNIPLISKQYGITVTTDINLSSQLKMKIFGTLQQTQNDHQMDAEGKISNSTDKSSPSFYGGFSINYLPIKSLSLFAGSYFYSAQTYRHYYYMSGDNAIDAQQKINNEDHISGKFILNVNASYSFYKQNKIFLGARNLLFDKSRETGFGDPVKAAVVGGMSFSF
jgi:iron complex outermembrane receptor protein